MIANKTLFLTEDRQSVVPEGDPKAKFLLVREGNELSDALAEKYGVKGDKKPAPADEPPQGGPAPQNREATMRQLKTRGKKPKK